MSPRLKGLAIFLCFMLVLVSSYPLSLVATCLAFVPFTLFMLGLSVLAVWSARSAARTTMDLSPLPLYRLTMVLIALAGLSFGAFLGITGALSRFAPHAPSGPRTQALEVQTGTFYVTPGQAAAFHALEIALVVAFGAAFVVGVLWHYRNNGAWKRSQQ